MSEQRSRLLVWLRDVHGVPTGAVLPLIQDVESAVAAPPLDELAAVLRGKDEMGEKLAKALGVPAGPLGRLVDAAIARLAAAEERGRRAGIEEAAKRIVELEGFLRDALWFLRPTETLQDTVARIDAALAPRDSGKDMELRAAVERKP